MASTITANAHGMIADQAFKFANLVPDNTGIIESTTYYVLAAGLTANTFRFSTSIGGTAFVLSYDLTDGSIIDPDTYVVTNDGVMTPPDPPATPSAPSSVTSALVTDSTGGVLVHLKVTL